MLNHRDAAFKQFNWDMTLTINHYKLDIVYQVFTFFPPRNTVILNFGSQLN